jgi:hypothetical protein
MNGPAYYECVHVLFRIFNFYSEIRSRLLPLHSSRMISFAVDELANTHAWLIIPVVDSTLIFNVRSIRPKKHGLQKIKPQ